jgi:hypothetical protein
MRPRASSLVFVFAVACGDTSGTTAPDAAVTDDAAVTEPDRYAAVEALIARSCSFEACHGGRSGQSQLNFRALLDAKRPLTEALNDVPSCQYPPFPRVAPHDPERSWLMVKLAGAYDAQGLLLFTPPEAPELSGADSDCPLVEEGELSFGQLMPINGTESRSLPEAEIALIRDWIAAGAPGP